MNKWMKEYVRGLKESNPDLSAKLRYDAAHKKYITEIKEEKAKAKLAKAELAKKALLFDQEGF